MFLLDGYPHVSSSCAWPTLPCSSLLYGILSSVSKVVGSNLTSQLRAGLALPEFDASRKNRQNASEKCRGSVVVFSGPIRRWLRYNSVCSRKLLPSAIKWTSNRNRRAGWNVSIDNVRRGGHTDANSPSSVAQFLISVIPDVSPTNGKTKRQNNAYYVSTSGTVTQDRTQAALYSISSSGQLSNGGEFISTSGLLPYAPFMPSAAVAAISTVFVSNNGSFAWNNSAFTGGQALFCQLGTAVDAVFSGTYPENCSPLTLEPVAATAAEISMAANSPTSSLSANEGSATMSTTTTSSPSTSAPGSVYGNDAVGVPYGAFDLDSNTPVLFGASTDTTSIESCLNFCTGNRDAYFGVSQGNSSIVDSILS